MDVVTIVGISVICFSSAMITCYFVGMCSTSER